MELDETLLVGELNLLPRILSELLLKWPAVDVLNFFVLFILFKSSGLKPLLLGQSLNAYHYSQLGNIIIVMVCVYMRHFPCLYYYSLQPSPGLLLLLLAGANGLVVDSALVSGE